MNDLSFYGMLGASDDVTKTFLLSTYPALSQAVSPVVYLVAVIYWVLFGYRIYAGHEAVKWNDFLTKTFVTVAIFSSLNWGGFAMQLYGFFTSFMESTASTIMAGEPTPNMLDALWRNVADIAATLMGVQWHQVGMILHGLGIFCLNTLLFVVALVYMSIAKFGLAITMVLLPIFVCFFPFERTRQWGMNWISMMLNFCFIYILVVAIIRFGFVAFHDAIQKIVDAKNLGGEIRTTIRSTNYIFIVEGVLIIFMLQIKSWAGALSGSVAVQGPSVVKKMLDMLPKGGR